MRLQSLFALLLFLSCLAAAHCRVAAREGSPNFIHCSPLPPPPLANFSQLLNHTDPLSPLFNQRFQYFDLRPHAAGDPVLFYAGPENAANAYTMSCTALLQFAQQLNASGIIAAEHRFFGSSWPDNLSKDNYRAVMATLTLTNILADYAAIINAFTRQGGHFEGGRVIVFGGSYGGFLAAMMRLTHGDVVFASVASASPVYLTGSGVDTGLWYDTVAKVFGKKDDKCAGAVSAAFAHLKSALDAGNFSYVQQQLDLCAVPTAPLVGEFMILAMHAAQIITQFNYPFKAAAKTPFPFQSFCADISTKPDPSLSDLRLLLDLGYNNSGTLHCFGPKQQQLQMPPEDMHRMPPATTPQPPPSLRTAFSDISFELSWYYITCTFFGLPIAAGAASQSFFSYSYPYNLPAINNYCQTTLFWSGVALQREPPINEDMIRNSSRIIFSNQDFDPVAPFSLSRSLSHTLLLLTIPNASHTQDVIAYDDQVARRMQRRLGIIVHPCVYAFSIHDTERRSKRQ